MKVSRRLPHLALWIVLAAAVTAAVSCGGSGETEASATPRPSVSATTSPVSGTQTATAQPASASPTATRTSASQTVTPAAGTATSRASTPSPTPFPALTPTPTSTPRPTLKDYVNESDGYSISVPTPWDIVESPDGVVTASGASTTVTIETSFIDRVATPNVQIYSAGHSPSFSGAWTDVQQLSTTSIRNGQAIEFHYQGSLNGAPQEMFIHWYFRGSLLIQVETRVDSQSWADKGVQDEVRDIVASFNPDANGALKTADDVLDALTARFAANAHSGIIARDEAAQGTVELTCAKAAEPYVQPPQYTGPGEWTVTTGLAPYGYNQWLVYEPDMQVVAGAGNATRC